MRYGVATLRRGHQPSSRRHLTEDGLRALCGAQIEVQAARVVEYRETCWRCQKALQNARS